jgi:hypothetical protein
MTQGQLFNRWDSLYSQDAAAMNHHLVIFAIASRSEQRWHCVSSYMAPAQREPLEPIIPITLSADPTMGTHTERSEAENQLGQAWPHNLPIGD